jgi:hypothetical protein
MNKVGPVLVDLLHYGSGLLLLGLGLMAMVGVHLPGVTVNPEVAIPGGLGVLAAGLKSSVFTGTVPQKN